jgi:type IV pilus assembly protein PilQ
VVSGPAKVRAIDVQADTGAVVVDVVATGPLGYETLTLKNPTRLVIDLPQSVLVDGRRQYPIDRDEVVGVRVAQFQARPPVTRVVVDLLSLVPYEIDSTAEGLRVTLGATEPAAELTQPPAEPAVVDTEAALEVEEVQVPLDGTEEPTVEPAPVLLASLAPMLPAALASAEAPEPEAVEPVEVMETSVEFAPMTPVAEPAPITTAFGPTPMQFQPPVGGEEEGPQYSGEPISVNLKNVDLKDFFRLIHEISGLNIIVDPNVSGSVTMVLIDVPWDQAFDIVLRNNRLGATLEGNVLRIATLATLKRDQEEQHELAQAREEAVDPVTVTRTLSYASGADLENTLRRFLSSRGEIIRDDRTNSLIIRDIPKVIPEIDNLIEQLDKKSLQVEIEARVVSASRSFMREIGSQFATAFSTTGGRSVFGGALGESPLETGSGLPPPPLVSGGGGSMPLVSDFPAAATSGFLFGHRSPNFALDVILTAAETRNIAKVLSKPRLVTQNNVTAEVQQGQRIPVQTVVNNTISTQFVDVTLRLSVTPQITADGTVFMDIIIENNRVDAGIARINGIPALATQSTTTQVLVADGGTVVIGGVMTSDNSTNVAQVPLLGSVPIIGHLFKRTTVTTSTSELLFFISPRILPG